MKSSLDQISPRARVKQLLNTRPASAVFVILIAVITVAMSLIGAPGIGILLSLVIIGVLLWQRRSGLNRIGFTSPASWTKTVGLGLLLGILFQVASVVLIEPIIEFITRTPVDLSQFENLRGNFTTLIIWLLVVWVFVVFVEEFIFRGFLMTELKKLLGESKSMLFLNLILTSALFGLAHWYQGPSGVLSTGLIGLVLGYVFIRTDFSLWLPIFLHGFIDTVGLTMLYLDADLYLRELWT